MAQYFTDFSEYTTNVQPSDWTRRWVTTNVIWEVREDGTATGGKYLFHERNALGGDRHVLSWDVIDADSGRADVELVFRWRADVSSPSRLNGLTRGSGTSSETGYIHGWAYGSYSGVQLAQYDGGSFSRFGQDSRGSYSGGTWIVTRVRVNGTDHKVRHWADADPEPETWDIEESNSDITAAGWVGFMQFSNGPVYEIDWIGVGTGGDVAPTDVSRSDAVAPDNAVHALGAGGAALTLTGRLVPWNGHHDQFAGAATIGQAQDLTPATTFHGHGAGSVAVSMSMPAGDYLGLNRAIHAHVGSAVVLAQFHWLAIDEAISLQSAGLARLFTTLPVPPGARLIRPTGNNTVLRPVADARIRPA